MENNSKPLKIVYLLPGGIYSPGGTDRITILKANYFSEVMGYDITIVTTEQMGRPVFFPLSEKVRQCHLDIGIHINFGKENYIQKCISRFLKTRQYRRELKKLLYSLKPDITVSTLGLDIDFLNSFDDGSIKIGELHFPGNFRQQMARKLSDAFIPNLVAKIRTQNMKRACKQLSRLVVLTNEEKECWADSRNIEVIPNALSYYPPSVSTCKNRKAIAVGRLAYEKGFDMLIDSWKKVHERFPDWELNIFGGGDQRENLQNQIIANNLDGVVHLHEPVKDILDRYLEHSMFLFPSRYLEALPMVLLEAESCGLPLAAFDAPCGPKDIIAEEKNGFLIKTGDIDALSEKICTLIESDELRKTMGSAAREHSLLYNEEAVMKQWITLFNSLLGR
ncbi:MAG: glycosyltransferase family 4 protein [Dysgonamonadaceae bacterium]|nr:glycosyltransferase family 4 protein [Dysgonamonadaceae bacterium]